jgi:hypothetical protein
MNIMKDFYLGLKFLFFLLLAAGMLLFLSAVYLRIELVGPPTSLLTERAFTIADTAVSVWQVALALCFIWFYMGARLFLSRNRRRLCQLPATLDGLRKSLDALPESCMVKELLPDFDKLLLSHILRTTNAITQMPLRVNDVSYKRIFVESSPRNARELLAPLRDDVVQLTRGASRAFGAAGVLSGVSLLVLYKLVSTVPVAVLSYKALIFVIGAYLYGRVLIGHMIAQQAHTMFSAESIGYLASRNNRLARIAYAIFYGIFKGLRVSSSKEAGFTLMRKTYGIDIHFPEDFEIEFYDSVPLKVYFYRKNHTRNSFGGIQLYRTLVPQNDQELRRQVNQLVSDLEGITVLKSSPVGIALGRIRAYLLEYESDFAYIKDNFIAEIARRSKIQGVNRLRMFYKL